jgi:hypothetical protein
MDYMLVVEAVVLEPLTWDTSTGIFFNRLNDTVVAGTTYTIQESFIKTIHLLKLWI